ncbi:DEAD/DEAH box helicase [Photobacterium sp. 1_MG-2023]|uniref:DEAD/DEAH box helicase n=1 Tax=Photobacterium sp. 1_MG-2023 TaxID=3062646 RepID=UPI0026E2C1C3|nr:DEAD/DEAH box helicase [Photobacterium sp. 1_MG-2023]MDO6707160.1 DEAD/DEAH box helicase [Photobacterium sp. 1_MG-2023]
MQYLKSDASLSQELSVQIFISPRITTKRLCIQLTNRDAAEDVENELAVLHRKKLIAKEGQRWQLTLKGLQFALQNLLSAGDNRIILDLVIGEDDPSPELEIYLLLADLSWMPTFRGYAQELSQHAEALLMQLLLLPEIWALLTTVEHGRVRESLQGWAWLLHQLYSTDDDDWVSQALHSLDASDERVHYWSPQADFWLRESSGRKEHPLWQPYNSEYLHRRTVLQQDLTPYSFTALLDLAVMTLLDKEEASHIYFRRREQLRFRVTQHDYAWEQFAYLITTTLEEQQDYFVSVDDWLDSVYAFDAGVCWGKLLLDVLILCQWQQTNTALYQQWVTQVLDHPMMALILAQKATGTLAWKAQQAFRSLTGTMSEDEPPFYQPAALQDIWLNKLTELMIHETQAAPEQRLAWELCTDTGNIQARVQALGKRGWTKGRLVQTHSLQYSVAAELMTDHDWHVMHQLERSGRGFGAHQGLRALSVLKALSACDNLMNRAGEPISLHGIKPLLILHASPDLKLEMYPQIDPKRLAQLLDDTWCFLDTTEISPALLSLIESRPEHLELGHHQSLLHALTQQQGLQWYSTVSGDGSIDPGRWDPAPHLWLDWQQGKLSVAIEHQNVVSEHGASNRVSRPSGQGERWISGPDATWYSRDLEQEKEASRSLLKRLGLKANQKRQWDLYGDDAMSLVKQLSSLEGIPVHWRQRNRQVQVLTSRDVALNIEKQQNWFTVNGKVKSDQPLELDLRMLLANSRQGYIQQDSAGLIVLLEDDLQQQLRMLDSLLNEEMQVDVQMAYPLQQLLETLTHDGDSGWQALQTKWSEKPVIAAHILAPLRDYQKVSVQWAAHLSHHGFGACLADDMGLGKTLQALSLIRHYAHQGAALVVAPKSVIHNWESECQRFAPELRVVDLEQAQDRSEAITSASEATIVLVSYGLMTRCQEALQSVSWQTIVMDEAQQIKNPQTKRAKLVFGLKAERRFTLTGTPVENHLTELWSQFAFLNPGLLGTIKHFKQKYGQADRSQEDMMRLKALISPFMMRRTKSEVLQELPGKTEITHTVYLSAKESAAYEAVRKDALKTAQRQQGVVEVLAALTRLRQVCCDASLVFDSFSEQSSKLKEALTLVTEALEGGHQILVFSQFVKLLKRFSGMMAQSSLSFSYLDGQSTSKQRKQAIEDFKSGKHQVFLISLKAGGTGLNLTEADTVIHLDPWWNPAVEDQASDRAHRMGQHRPVTVYRLVTENTVEEKIIQLHRDKRDLAEKVLSGQDNTQALNPQMLLSMIED